MRAEVAGMRQYVKEAKARADAANNFPVNTDGCSRHAMMIADELAKGRIPIQVADDPEHVAASIYDTVAALWELRSKTACDGVSRKEIG